jgi:hypothetical protein
MTHAASYTVFDSSTGSADTYNTLAGGVATNPETTASLSAGTYYSGSGCSSAQTG